MQITHKIALDPTEKQKNYFARAAGTHRFIWNWAATQWDEQYKAGLKPNGHKLELQFNAIYKDQFPWVGEVHCACHIRPFADLQMAYDKFFRGSAEKPVLKKKGKNHPSFYIPNHRLGFKGKKIRFPVIGWIRMHEKLRVGGKIMSIRVIEDAGHWFACINVEIGESKRQRINDSVVGVDLGINKLATLSTGEEVDNSRPHKKAVGKLKRAQKKFRRRQTGSKNHQKQRRVLAKIHNRVKNIRHDGLHKLTSKLTKNHGVVVIENLGVEGLKKNHRLAFSISDVGFGLFRKMLTYKAELNGTSIVVADKYFPSSKKCSQCGQVKDKLSLSERVFRCSCGLEIDRDLNAAYNLRKIGMDSPEFKPVDMQRCVNEAGTTPEVATQPK